MVKEYEISALRELGKQLRDISSDPVNEERKLLWNHVNGLKRVRPPVFIYEIPWGEMEYNDELKNVCENSFLRAIETKLRRIIYQWRHMPGDMVVENYIESPISISNTGFGVEESRGSHAEANRDDTVLAKKFAPVIKTEADIENIKNPEIKHDEEESDRNFCLLGEIFGEIIEVKKEGIKKTSIASWDHLVRLTGINEVLTDMIMRPDFVHKAIKRITEANLSALEQFERLNLLSLNNDNTYMGGGLQYTDELPGKHFEPNHIRPLNMWGRSMSQIFSTVSPAMHDEFALQYELKYLSKFGLNYYGCCEPLDKKIKILRKIPNLRKISMSPWVDVQSGAAEIGNDYVYSMKANPAFLASTSWGPEVVRKDLEYNLKGTGDCVTEIILKDITTVQNEPRRLWEWAKIAVETAEELY